MTWFRIDDSFHDHPKTRKLSGNAVGLWVRAGSWSARHLTDGEVPAWVARDLCPVAHWRRVCGSLVAANLWEHDAEKDVYMFHDWDEYNPPRETVKRRRRAAAARQTAYRLGKSGERNGVTNASPGGTSNGVTNGVTDAVTDGVTNGVTNGVSHGAPVPTHISDRHQSGAPFARARDDDDDEPGCQDDMLSDIAVAMATATGRTITRDQAAEIRARILDGRNPSNPHRYVLAAIRNAEDPRRLIPARPAAVPAAAPVGDVLRMANSPDGIERRPNADAWKRGGALARELLGMKPREEPEPQDDEPDEEDPPDVEDPPEDGDRPLALDAGQTPWTDPLAPMWPDDPLAPDDDDPLAPDDDIPF